MMQKKPWPSTPPKNIIIRMPNWLGDAVMATPLLDELRAAFPHSRLTVMCQANIAPLFENDVAIDEVFSFKKSSGWIRGHRPDIMNTLSLGKYDLGVLTTNSFSSAWWFFFGNVKNRLGYATNMRSILLNKAVSFPEKKETQHQVITYKMLLEPLGIPISDRDPRLYLAPQEVEAAKVRLQRQGAVYGKNTIIGINPGAAYGSAKCWLPDRFVAVSKRLLEDPNTYLVYFGDPAGAPLVKAICAELDSSRVINVAGETTIRELIALIDCCTVLLTNDSGPMHIAAALKTPLVALFGSTSDVKTPPYKQGTVIHKHVECSPCYKRECPIDFRCMTRISVDEVYDAILALACCPRCTSGGLPIIGASHSH